MGTVNWKSIGLNGIIRFWWLWLLLAALLLIPSLFGLGRLGMDSSNETFMPENDPVTLKNDHFKELFGSEEFFFILIEADDIYSPETLTKIGALENDLQDYLPFLNDTTSIVSAEAMSSEDGFLIIDSLEDTGIPEDPDILRRIRETHLESLLYPGRILSRDGRKAGIMVTLTEYPESVWAMVPEGYSAFDEEFLNLDSCVLADNTAEEPGTEGSWVKLEDPNKDVTATLLAIIKKYNSEDFRIHVTGMPYMDYFIDDLTINESWFFGLLSFIAASLMLVLLFRRVRPLIAPLLVFILTMVYLFGIMGLLDLKFSVRSIVIIPLLLVISVSYSIHMINQIRKGFALGLSNRDAIGRAYGEAAWPCLLTAVTTAAGFLSFLFVPAKPIRELGIETALGTMIAFLLVMFIIPLFYLAGKERPVKTTRRKLPNISWDKWNSFVYKNGIVITIVAIIIAGLSFWGALGIRPSSDTLETIGTKADFVSETIYVSSHLGGTYSAEVLIELPEEDMAKRPDVLKALQHAGEMAAADEQVSLTISLADLILELDRVLREVPPEEASIPDDTNTVAQYLLLYEMSGGEALEDWTDFGYQTLRLSIMIGSSRTDFAQLSENLTAYLQESLPPGSVVTVTGDMPVMIRMMELLIDSQIKSCLAALAFIALLLLVILKSIRRGLLAVIPNLFPILTTLGLMGHLGWALDFVTAMIAPMLIGIAVDDTVHFFIHYKKYRRTESDPREASRQTFRSVGSSLVFTSVVLVGGFILFSFSRMRSLQHLGVLTAAGIASALLADLFLSPLLLGRFDRKNPAQTSLTSSEEEINEKCTLNQPAGI